MVWVPPSSSKRVPAYLQLCPIHAWLALKVLFDIALRQATGFIESLLQLVGLNWIVPDFSILRGNQKSLTVHITYRGVTGPLGDDDVTAPRRHRCAKVGLLHSTLEGGLVGSYRNRSGLGEERVTGAWS